MTDLKAPATKVKEPNWQPLEDWAYLRKRERIRLTNSEGREIITTVLASDSRQHAYVVTSHGSHSFQKDAGWFIEYDAVNTPLPKTGYVLWADADHNQRVAHQTGHPANDVWALDGVQLDGAELITLIGGLPQLALTPLRFTETD